jgi:predicted transcriptional regulator
MKVNTQIAIEKASSSTALAELLGISKGAISQWGEDLPEDRAKQLVELRPHWFPESAAILAGAFREKIERLEAPAAQTTEKAEG